MKQHSRVFGPAQGEYATSLTAAVENGVWQSEDELGLMFSRSMEYAHFRGGVEKNTEAFSSLARTVELVAQERDSPEYAVTDLDHYYEFLGGFSCAVKNLTQNDIGIMVVDSAEDKLYAEDVSRSIDRASRTRLLNPRWIDGMLAHQYHGSQKIKDRVEYLLGFAATTGKVDSGLFDAVAERYFFDDALRERFIQNNRHAVIKTGELLVESSRRGYWRADRKKADRIRDMVLLMEGDVE